MESLNDAQRDILSNFLVILNACVCLTFQALSGTEDLNKATDFLKRHEWSLESAAAHYFETGFDGPRRRMHASPSSTGFPVETPPSQATGPSTSRVSNAVQRPVRSHKD